MALQIRLSFRLYADVSLMYIDVVCKVMQEGIVFVDRLALLNHDLKVPDKKYFAAQQQALTPYSE
jgi:hypothetical protein